MLKFLIIKFFKIFTIIFILIIVVVVKLFRMIHVGAGTLTLRVTIIYLVDFMGTFNFYQNKQNYILT